MIPPDSARARIEAARAAGRQVVMDHFAERMERTGQGGGIQTALIHAISDAALKVGDTTREPTAASPLVERLRAALVYLCNAMDKAEGHSIADAYLRARALLAESIQEGPQ